jgi:hypothetical protein
VGWTVAVQVGVLVTVGEPGVLVIVNVGVFVAVFV